MKKTAEESAFLKNQKLLLGQAIKAIRTDDERGYVSLRKMEDAVGIPASNIYVEKVSGKDFDRPEYKKMLNKLDENAVLYVKSIDRLGRNYDDLQEQWRIITKEKGADIVIIDMPILDTRREKNLLGNFISDMVLTLLSYVAENERLNIKQRQAEGIAAAKKRGVKFGRPVIPIPDNFHDMRKAWRNKEISLEEAANKCKMPVKTFYYKARMHEKNEII